MLVEEISIIRFMQNLLRLIICFLGLVPTAFGAMYSMPAPGNDIVGHAFVTQVRPGDSLDTLRQRYEISYDSLVAANPNINFYRLRIGQKVVIPAEYILPKFRRGIVINIPELRLYYFTPDGRYVYTFPVGLGREDWRTPTAITKVIQKQEDPYWHVPESIREYTVNKTGELLPDVVPPGPKNPLGKYALVLGKTGYLIHGTNVPSSVGTFISSGCMRLLSDPIETLYYQVSIGTPVYIIHYPNKAGWFGDTLYLESHAPKTQYANSDQNPALSNMDAETAIYESVHNHPAYVSWHKVHEIENEQEGLPEPIGQRYEPGQ